MAFSMGCFACCVPCDPCDAVCDETPDEAFAVVYQVEDDRANLTWTGDAMGPIDGPWSGFENDPGPYTQEITSGSIALPGSRFPCYFRLKLWRNVGGGEGSDALDNERVTISCTQGKVNLGVVVLNAGESLEVTTDPESSTATYAINGTRIALDTNGGDRHAHPPASWQVVGDALCANTSVTVQASIQWSNDLIQHNLYGEFVECFDELPPGDPDDCLDCDGTPTPAPETVYLTISNFDAGGAVDANGDPINYDGTYAVALDPTTLECDRYLSYFASYDILDTACNPPIAIIANRNLRVMLSGGVLFLGPFVGIRQSNGSKMIAFFAVSVGVQEAHSLLCASVASLSGVAAGPWKYQCGAVATDMDLSFDWELTL